jgi:hypothetical protein
MSAAQMPSTFFVAAYKYEALMRSLGHEPNAETMKAIEEARARGETGVVHFPEHEFEVWKP